MENIDLWCLEQGTKKNIWAWISASKQYNGENYIIQILITCFTPRMCFHCSINLDRPETRIGKIRVIVTVSFKNQAFWPPSTWNEQIHLRWGRINFSSVGLCCTNMLQKPVDNLSSLKYNHSIIFSGFGGLEVACWPLVPKFACSNPAEAVGFLRVNKNP